MNEKVANPATFLCARKSYQLPRLWPFRPLPFASTTCVMFAARASMLAQFFSTTNDGGDYAKRRDIWLK